MKKQSLNALHRTRSDRVFDRVNILFNVLFLLIFLFPLWYVLIASVSDPAYIWRGDVVVWPKGFHLEGYKSVFSDRELMTGFRNSAVYTVGGTLISLFFTISAAFPIAQREFTPRNFIMKLFAFTMFFSGGLIPTYMLVRDLGMLDTVWSIMVPGSLSIMNVIIVRTYFQTSLPNELREAAFLDGANYFRYLFQIVLPLSKPVLAVMALYYGVGHWNQYFRAMIYLFDRDLFPLQLLLREILASATAMMRYEEDLQDITEILKRAETLKYCVIVVAAVPAMAAYPLVQKYFVKGVMIGSVKG